MKTLMYFIYTIKEFIETRKFFTITQSIKHYPEWTKTFDDSNKNLNIYIPWMNFEIVSFLKKKLNKEMNVFEFGSGYSTIFFALRAGKIVSLEHNSTWYKNVELLLKENNINNVDYKLIEAELIDGESRFEGDYLDYNLFVSEDTNFKNFKFEKYVTEINKFPDKYFDLIVIDGRARPACIFFSLKKIKPDGMILVDNTERDYYLKNLLKNGLLNDWEITLFSAHIPQATTYHKTTLLKRK